MNEEVLAAVVGGYETEPLLVIEPLHRSAQPLTHCLDLFLSRFFSLCVCFSLSLTKEEKTLTNPNRLFLSLSLYVRE